MFKKWIYTILVIVLFVSLYFFSNALGSMAEFQVRTLFNITDKTRMMQVSLLADFVPIAIMFIFSFFVFKQDTKKIWLKHEGVVKKYILGYLAGIILFCAFVVLSMSTKNINYAGPGELGILNVLLFIPAFAVQSFEEELLTRGILQRFIKDKLGVLPSIILPSLLFVVLHLANNGIQVVAMINLFVVGVLFSLMVYATGSLWYAAAAHAAWNFTQGTIFGLSVSGNDFGGSLLKFNTIGKNNLFTGGEYGPEGTVFVAIVLILGAVFYYYKIRKNNIVLESR